MSRQPKRSVSKAKEAATDRIRAAEELYAVLPILPPALHRIIADYLPNRPPRLFVAVRVRPHVFPREIGEPERKQPSISMPDESRVRVTAPEGAFCDFEVDAALWSHSLKSTCSRVLSEETLNAIDQRSRTQAAWLAAHDSAVRAAGGTAAGRRFASQHYTFLALQGPQLIAERVLRGSSVVCLVIGAAASGKSYNAFADNPEGLLPRAARELFRYIDGPDKDEARARAAAEAKAGAGSAGSAGAAGESKGDAKEEVKASSSSMYESSPLGAGAEVHVSVVELWPRKVVDLIASPSLGRNGEQVAVKTMEQLASRRVQSTEEAMRCFRGAYRKRLVASTAMCATSTRYPIMVRLRVTRDGAKLADFVVAEMAPSESSVYQNGLRLNESKSAKLSLLAVHRVLRELRARDERQRYSGFWPVKAEKPKASAATATAAERKADSKGDSKGESKAASGSAKPKVESKSVPKKSSRPGSAASGSGSGGQPRDIALAVARESLATSLLRPLLERADTQVVALVALSPDFSQETMDQLRTLGDLVDSGPAKPKA